MSIQPNRVVARIIAQVDQSDWPPLAARVVAFDGGQGSLRVYRAPAHPCYATPIHFWVHALREDLVATERRVDLVGAAGHALCRRRPLSEWRAELDKGTDEAARAHLGLDGIGDWPAGTEVYRMLESECRRSSVVDHRDGFVADFWGHGGGASWRRRAW